MPAPSVFTILADHIFMSLAVLSICIAVVELIRVKASVLAGAPSYSARKNRLAGRFLGLARPRTTGQVSRKEEKCCFYPG
jgi:hypothetical protein